MVFRFVPEQIVANQLSLFDLGAKVPKRIVKYNFCFSIWERSSKTNGEKLGVVNDNWFWTGDDDGMAQRYTNPGCRDLLVGSSSQMAFRGKQQA